MPINIPACSHNAFFWLGWRLFGAAAPEGFLCESVKPKFGKKAKRDLQEPLTLASIPLVITIGIWVWDLPHSAHREFGFCEFCSWAICCYHLPCRSVLGTCCGKETKIFRFPDYCPCFCHLPPSCEQVQRKKECRKIFFDQEQHHMVTLVLLHSLLFRRSLCTEEGNFIMIVCKDFQQSELMICRDYLVNCERYLICPATEEAQWLTVWGTTMIFARSTSHKREHLV